MTGDDRQDDEGRAPGSTTRSPTTSRGASISLAVVNARIWTGDAGRPWAGALAVRGDRLAAVGSSAEVRKLATDGARVIDAAGALVVATPMEGGALVRDGAADFVLLEHTVAASARVDEASLAGARRLLEVVAGRVLEER